MIMKECVCCFGCQQPIRDRYLMCVSEHYWHETCLQCTVCRISLTSSCYVKEKKIYCKSDYNKLYATKCSICLGSIDSNELVMRVHSYVYHLPCFNCIWCRRQLRKGDKFALRGRQPICEIDLAKENIEISPSSLTLHSFDTDSLIPSLIPNRHHIHHLNHLNLSEHHHLRSQPDLAIYEMSNGFGCGGGHSPTSSPSIIDGSLQSIGSMIPNHGPLTNKQNLCLDPLVDSCGRQQHPFSSRALTICDSTTVLSPAAIKNDPSLSYPPSTPSPTMQQQPPPSIPPQSQSSSASSISHAMNNGNSMQNNPHHNHHGNTNNNSSTNTSIPIKQDGRRGPKRPRTILTTAQRRAFKASFEISQKPCRKVRETLAKETGLSVRIVQVWFQNQRAKVCFVDCNVYLLNIYLSLLKKLKKIQRKQQQQQLSQSGGGLMLGNGSESGGGLGSSDKSKGDSTDEDDDVDEDDDDDDSQRFSLPYMLQSPDGGSYYSGRGEEDGYTVKSELGGLDDSETSLCEMDDGIIHRPTSASDPIRLSSNSSSSGTSVVNQNNNNSNSMPFGLMMISNNGPISSSLSQQQHAQQLPPASSHHHPTSTAFSTNDSHHIPHHPSLPIHHNPHLNPFQHHQNHSSLPTSNQIHSLPNMTPIDKLYSMQNSYFNNPSECEC
ncbi:hypothetical protein NH340_JMT07216 [Sarcoptes scabiei]|nr:hypothetical protein NH340_JMT07216 [Sarcoptes scabiei]